MSEGEAHATLTMARISAYEDPRRAAESLERRDRARSAVAANGGRSAPRSAMDFTPSAVAERAANAARAANPGAAPQTDDQLWAGMFPTLPNGTTRISARGTAPTPVAPVTGITATTPTTPRIDARAAAADAVIPSITLDPNLPPATVTNTGITRDMPPAPTPSPGDGSSGPVGATGPGHRFAPDSLERGQLRAAHPEIFTAGTPENAAFVAHAQEHGEASAHANIQDILASTQQGTPQGNANPDDQ